MNILPYKVSVFFHYECPRCNSEIVCSLEQIKNFPTITCSCGCNTNVNKIINCDIDPLFENGEKFAERIVNRKKKEVGFVEPVISNKTSKDQKFIDLAVGGLVKFGHKKLEATKMVMEYLEIYQLQQDIDTEFTTFFAKVYEHK